LLRPRKKRNTVGIGKPNLFLISRWVVIFIVKIISSSGNETKFDSKDVKKDLEAAGLPERVAEEVAERVEDRVEDHWTTIQVNEQVDIELKRLDEDIQRAEGNYKEKFAGPANMPVENRTETGRSETFVPATEKERHEDFGQRH
jgi:hypothetical protein